MTPMSNLSGNKWMNMSKSKKWFTPSPEQIENWIKENFDYKVQGAQILINNPDGDQKFHMQISPTLGLVHDFRPNHQQYDGSFLKFVSKFKGISMMAAIAEVCGKGRVISQYQKVIEEEPEIENDDVIALPEGSIPLKGGSGKIWEVAMNYLVNVRKFTKEEVFQANIHHLGTNIVVPYYQYGMIVFWQSRMIVDKKFKFPNGEDKSAGNHLYGFDDVEPCGEAIVVESIFNKLSIGSDAVATGGASLKDGQIKLLRVLNPTSLTLAPDGDDAGIKSITSDFYSLSKYRNDAFIKDLWYCLPPLNSHGWNDWNDMRKDGADTKDYILKNRKKLTLSVLFSGITRSHFR